MTLEYLVDQDSQVPKDQKENRPMDRQEQKELKGNQEGMGDRVLRGDLESMENLDQKV